MDPNIARIHAVHHRHILGLIAGARTWSDLEDICDNFIDPPAVDGTLPPETATALLDYVQARAAEIDYDEGPFPDRMAAWETTDSYAHLTEAGIAPKKGTEHD